MRWLLCAALLFTSSAYARADAELLGEWTDNAPRGTRIGNLTISEKSINIAGFATYSVDPVGMFGSGELFRVRSVRPTPDPAGCGPQSTLTYIVIEPIKLEPIIKLVAIRLILYGGSYSPQLNTISADPAVCEIHAFTRLG
jgi:hypothetical protein